MRGQISFGERRVQGHGQATMVLRPLEPGTLRIEFVVQIQADKR